MSQLEQQLSDARAANDKLRISLEQMVEERDEALAALAVPPKCDTCPAANPALTEALNKSNHLQVKNGELRAELDSLKKELRLSETAPDRDVEFCKECERAHQEQLCLATAGYELHRWNSGARPVTAGDLQYVIMIRHPEDPGRRPRPKGGQEDKTPHRTIAKMDIEEIKKVLLEQLSDGEPRTLNRLGVEIWDKTADITSGTKVEEALWQLVERSILEHTMKAPVMFRKKEPQ